jgi:hypothetical protein
LVPHQRVGYGLPEQGHKVHRVFGGAEEVGWVESQPELDDRVGYYDWSGVTRGGPGACGLGGLFGKVV